MMGILRLISKASEVQLLTIFERKLLESSNEVVADKRNRVMTKKV
jgi:hypothetical protein